MIHSDSSNFVAGVNDLYSLWNIKLLETFFSPASKGVQVWLQLDPAELDFIGPELGGDEGFLNAVRKGPAWVTCLRNGYYVEGKANDLVQKVMGLVNQRRSPTQRPSSYLDPGKYSTIYLKQNAPSYLPFLVALVRSASLAEHGFYSHLRDTLNLPANWGSQQMEALEFAWKDLEDWTKQTNGEFGAFEFRTLGGFAHIGVPRSQSIMSRRDCELISRVFAQVGARTGQQATPRLLSDVRSVAATAFFLSSGFRDALSREVFNEPINARLHSLFEDWDGTVPSNGEMQREGDSTALVEHEDIELSLSLQDGNQFPWNIHWRVPAVRDSGEVIVSWRNVEWRASIRGTELTATRSGSQETACLALADSSMQDITFDMAFVSEDGDRIKLGNIYLRKVALRIFIWAHDSYARRDELREHALPLHGPAFILASPDNAVQVFNWLNREQIIHNRINSNGLPPEWVLVCISDCNALSQEQRNEIPDGEGERTQHRVIRLVGGRTVRRAGIRQYMSYDLPSIELDAPEGVVISAPGLRLNEEMASSNPDHRSALRRFQITPESLGPRSFSVEAMHKGRQIGKVTLRVAADSGEQVEMGKAFSLDSQGAARRDDSGLRGVLPISSASGSPSGTQYFSSFLHVLGRSLQTRDVIKMQSNAITQFLDTLAQIGSIAYGSARDQLGRQMANYESNVSPSTILLNLRSRGYLEIETNTKGHLVRIYSVSPSLYELPIKIGGQHVFGVLGSLRHSQWELLATLGNNHEICHCEAYDGTLNVWRIVVREVNMFVNQAMANGFVVQRNVSFPMAAWAAKLEDVRKQIELIAGEGIRSDVMIPERLSPQSGRFFSISVIDIPPNGPDCQLFRMEDRDMGRLQVYVLGIYKQEKGPRFGFVRDSRWGIWIALGAFADFMKQQYGICDASPWPIPYLPADGTFLLPARLSLPVVLERVLNLCSGSGPEVINMQVMIREQTPVQSQYITLVRKSDKKEIANISRVYEEMATGKWLAYKSVPAAIARIIAIKLGGTIVNA